jgi:hypothetical protein
MTKIEKIDRIQNEPYLPFYIRNAKVDILKDDASEFFNVTSNRNAYQTKKHPHLSLYKPIILLNEKL